MAQIATNLSDSRRIYVQTRYGEPVVGQLKALGAHWDAEARAWWLGAAKRADVEALLADAAAGQEGEPAQEDPHTVRLVGKARYKGRDYYCRWVGQTKSGEHLCRLVSLDHAVDFWADCARPGESCDGNGELAVLTKTYPVREYRGRQQYTTLGSIRDFLVREKSNRERGGAVCAECGKSGDLVTDLEDGLLKHYRCCDIPPG